MGFLTEVLNEMNSDLTEVTIDQSGKILQDNRQPTASALARQFVKVAMKAGDGYAPDVAAKKLAANFHKAIIDAIDEELVINRATRVSSYGPVSVRA